MGQASRQSLQQVSNAGQSEKAGDIAKHMNTMQHYYSELYKEVGTSGRLVMEACLDLYCTDNSSSGGTDSTKIDAAHAAGQIFEHTRDQLHELRKASNKGVHRHSAPFQPQDKVTVANATYTIGTMICSDFLLRGDLPTAAPTGSWTHQMAEETARITSELAKIQPVKKFANTNTSNSEQDTAGQAFDVCMAGRPCRCGET